MAGRGRPKGVKDSKPRTTAASKQAKLALSQGGLTPLEMMIKTAEFAWYLALKMLAEKAPTAKVLAMMRVASKESNQAAPYLHARLSSVEMDANLNVTIDDLRRLGEEARAEAAKRGIDFAPAERPAPGALPH